ncbi:hypothetical protein SAMN05216388_10723 [Halorientalis persicus]|uniref:MarR family protein n=1 Tax=Halorientalis persicus TaxID=1367881 RepID=A0A1H8WRN3_9EURY|nr:helix-turn-helix domain-containing protein [Halorientalis persicus]SEP30340.1 hypothetical protein SAMN05216388_10723 [Halorientalis persicus]
MSVKIPGDVKDLSPTARLVHAVLDDAGPLAREEIEDRTGAARRTVNKVLATLRAEGLATAHEHPNDARRKLYSISKTSPPVLQAPQLPSSGRSR